MFIARSFASNIPISQILTLQGVICVQEFVQHVRAATKFLSNSLHIWWKALIPSSFFAYFIYYFSIKYEILHVKNRYSLWKVRHKKCNPCHKVSCWWIRLTPSVFLLFYSFNVALAICSLIGTPLACVSYLFDAPIGLFICSITWIQLAFPSFVQRSHFH